MRMAPRAPSSPMVAAFRSALHARRMSDDAAGRILKSGCPSDKSQGRPRGMTSAPCASPVSTRWRNERVRHLLDGTPHRIAWVGGFAVTRDLAEGVGASR